jgi:hypothetical protein
MYDFIGDIHGHSEELTLLLKKMGYTWQGDTYSHPERKVIFVGDYIDRGPDIPGTLRIVRSMVDSGHAIALMGNHEYNALCFHYTNPAGGHLRQHSIKNIMQHFKTMEQFRNNVREYESYIEWFKSLPLFLEGEGFNAVHACWDKSHINFLKKTLSHNKLTDAILYQSVRKETKLHVAVEETLKGKELKIPGDQSFRDKDGHQRNQIRIKWWQDPSSSTYRNYSLIDLPDLPEAKIELDEFASYYNHLQKPVFFGHYWLEGNPTLYRENVCCLDYSVAKAGKLVSYRWSGEESLKNEKLIFV